MQRAEAAIAADLLGAVSGAASGQHRSLMLTLKRSFKDAREQLGKEVEARAKVAAVLGGLASFKALADGSGRVQATYRSGPRTDRSECVHDIPLELLAAVLASVMAENDAATVANLRPEAMALVSPRMFWALVRHGGVGPAKGFKVCVRV